MRSQLGIRQCEDEQTLLWLSNISYSIQFEDMRNKTAAELNKQRVSAAEPSSSEVTQTVSSFNTVKSTSDTTTAHTQTPPGDSSTSAHSTGDRCDINCTCCYKVSVQITTLHTCPHVLWYSRARVVLFKADVLN